MQRGSAAKTNGRTTAKTADRLAFVEALLAIDDMVEASSLAVDWLAQHTATRQIVIALVDDDRVRGPRLVGVASRGVARSAVAALDVDLEADHPLVAALTKRVT